MALSLSYAKNLVLQGEDG